MRLIMQPSWVAGKPTTGGLDAQPMAVAQARQWASRLSAVLAFGSPCGG
ncbi:hypothetical protein [Rivihabitans pingtungensis]|nr:hypothetical protein [Rivihabitans pingtungensis]